MDAVLSDGRKVIDAVTTTGSTSLPAIFSFTSSVASALEVVAGTGVTTLRMNHHSQVQLTVRVSDGHVNGNRLNVWCNLRPQATGDLDLGAASGAPVQTVSVGNSFVMPVRVNTGSNILGAFDFTIAFDGTAMTTSSDNVEVIAPSSAGVVDISTSIDTDAGTVRVVGTIVNSQVRGPAVSLSLIHI